MRLPRSREFFEVREMKDRIWVDHHNLQDYPYAGKKKTPKQILIAQDHERRLQNLEKKLDGCVNAITQIIVQLAKIDER